MKTAILLIVVFLGLAVGYNNGLWDVCSTVSDCDDDTNKCENGFCVANDYAYVPLRNPIPLSTGSFQGLFVQTDSNSIPRDYNSTRIDLTQHDITEGIYELSQTQADIMAWDVHVLADVSASIYNATSSYASLQTIVNSIASALFTDSRTNAFLSVHAFAGMDDYMTLVEYQSESSGVEAVFDDLDPSTISDQSSNLYGAATNLATYIRLAADGIPDGMKEADYVAKLFVIITDGYDTAGRDSSANAIAAITNLGLNFGFTIGVPNPDVDDISLTGLSDVSVPVGTWNHTAMMDYSESAGVNYGTIAMNMMLPFFENAVLVNYCPQARSGDVDIVISDIDDDEAIEWNVDIMVTNPSCANVWEASSTEEVEFDASVNEDLACYDGSARYICGFYQNHFCGDCSDGNSLAASITSGSSYSDTYYRFSSNAQESVTISFSSAGSDEAGFRAYARLGSTPVVAGRQYAYYAPEAEIIETEDDCASCDEYTYTWGQDCSTSVDLTIEGINPTDEWYVYVDACEPEDAEPDDGIPTDTTYAANEEIDATADAFVIEVSVTGSSLGGGVITGIVIGGMVGAALLGAACFFGVKKIKNRGGPTTV